MMYKWKFIAMTFTSVARHFEFTCFDFNINSQKWITCTRSDHSPGPVLLLLPFELTLIPPQAEIFHIIELVKYDYFQRNHF